LKAINRQQSERQPVAVAPLSPTNCIESGGNQVTAEADTLPPALKRFKYLTNKMMSSSDTFSSTQPAAASIQGQIDNYLCELQQSPDENNAITFWSKRHASYSLLAELAEDLLTAPASQAFVERIFSLCGWFTTGRSNQLIKNLEMRVFFKLNRHLCIA
jgi:hypothetical protein